jgi:hypothetical protein
MELVILDLGENEGAIRVVGSLPDRESGCTCCGTEDVAVQVDLLWGRPTEGKRESVRLRLCRRDLEALRSQLQSALRGPQQGL